MKQQTKKLIKRYMLLFMAICLMFTSVATSAIAAVYSKNETALFGVLTPGDATPGDATPGDATPGDATPGDATPGDATPEVVIPVTSITLNKTSLALNVK